MSTHPRTADGPVTAVLFEPYGTLIDIETDERDWYAYLHLSRFLEYRGIRLSADELRWLWFEKTARQLAESREPYPDIDAWTVWQEMVGRNAICDHHRACDRDTFVSDVTALHRAMTRRTFQLMDGVRPLLESLGGRVRLGVVADGQREYVLPELRAAGIKDYFDTVVVSGEHGYRKPDPRLFQQALATLGIPAEQTLFVGVDTGRDVAGARRAGMRAALVLTPYGSKDIALGEPDYVVDQTADIAGLIDRLTP